LFTSNFSLRFSQGSSSWTCLVASWDVRSNVLRLRYSPLIRPRLKLSTFVFLLSNVWPSQEVPTVFLDRHSPFSDSVPVVVFLLIFFYRQITIPLFRNRFCTVFFFSLVVLSCLVRSPTSFYALSWTRFAPLREYQALSYLSPYSLELSSPQPLLFSISPLSCFFFFCFCLSKRLWPDQPSSSFTLYPSRLMFLFFNFSLTIPPSRQSLWSFLLMTLYANQATSRLPQNSGKFPLAHHCLLSISFCSPHAENSSFILALGFLLH